MNTPDASKIIFIQIKIQIMIQKYALACTLLAFVVISACNKKTETQKEILVQSPDAKIKIQFLLNDSLMPSYKVSYNDKAIINLSTLGVSLKDMPNLSKDF